MELEGATSVSGTPNRRTTDEELIPASTPLIGSYFWLLLLFVGSGCAALIYEVVWYQSLALIVGSNAVSMAVVLATFMGGMTLGSLALLRWSRREVHPLKVYAVLEFAIGVFGLLIAYALPWAGGLYTALGGSGFAGILLRGLFCALFLLAPTMAMGATLPVVAGWVRNSPAGVTWVGFFYAANIAGGVLGCLLSAFYLLRVHDNLTASQFAVVLNLLVAAGAWLQSRQPIPAAVQTAVAPPAVGPSGATPACSPRRIYLAIALSGACALAAEVVWTRNLALLLGGTIYTFALILAAMLIGLGIGSGLGAAAARNSAYPDRALGVCQLLAMLGIAWAAWSMTQALPNWPIEPRLAPSPKYLFELDCACALWCVLPAALCWGASFPLAFAAAAQVEHNKARAMARIYAANTSGAIAGALLTSLLFMSWLGTQDTQRLLIVLAAVGAVLMFAPAAWVRPPRLAMRPASIAALSLIAVVAIATIASVQPIPGLLVGYGRQAVTWIGQHGDFIYVGEGVNSTMAVSHISSGELIYHNAGKPQASTEPQDMRLQRMLGHLTTLLARDPQRVLVIGCGAGITAGAISVSPAVRQETIVEIEPLVPRAASRYFSKQNDNVIGNPKVHVQIDDARHFLLTTHEKFDAISTDPFDTWVKGAATLNTQEFFEEMRRHLTPGGVVTVWIHFYETNESAVKSELATFIKVFPNAIVFGNTIGGQGYDGVMVGSPDPLKIDIDALAARLQRSEYAPVRQSLSDVFYNSVSDLLSTVVADGPQLTSWLGDAQINRDRNLRLQYLAGFGNNNNDEAKLYRELVHHGGWPQNLFTGNAASLSSLRQTQAKQLLAADGPGSD